MIDIRSRPSETITHTIICYAMMDENSIKVETFMLYNGISELNFKIYLFVLLMLSDMICDICFNNVCVPIGHI